MNPVDKKHFTLYAHYLQIKVLNIKSPFEHVSTLILFCLPLIKYYL